MSDLSNFVAIDPLALLLPSRAYVIVAEKLHPHVPKLADLREGVATLNVEERKFVLARARTLAAYAKAIEEALG
jgi:hypothetical protein